jgi:DNA-binding MarR family transcriptional regulator
VSHPTVDLDDVVHQRTRLGILAILSRGDRVEFGYLKDALGLSAGNLSRHLTTLVEALLVTIHKGYQGRRARTWVTITKRGANAYRDEMTVLRSLVALADAVPGTGTEPGDPPSEPTTGAGPAAAVSDDADPHVTGVVK